MKNFAAFAVAVVLGIVLSFSQAKAFQFPWSPSPTPPHRIAKRHLAQMAESAHEPAPAGAPEPYERPIPLPSWAPLVKRVMPTVVNVAVTQEASLRSFGTKKGRARARTAIRTVQAFHSDSTIHSATMVHLRDFNISSGRSSHENSSNTELAQG